MSVLNRKIIMWAVDIGWDDGCEVASIFFSVSTVHSINETFRICVSFVGGVGRTVVKHGFINGISGLIGKDAGGKHGD